jgi:inosose dehydratase
LDADRVLREAASVGLAAMEAGPDGFLPHDPADTSDALARHDLNLVGGFVPVVLHRREVREAELSSMERKAEFFAAAGADVLVLGASTGSEGYEESVELDDASWEELFGTLSSIEEICARYGLAVALHPHYGTVIERSQHVRRFLDGCGMGLCLDTGHLMVGGSDPLEVLERAVDRVRHVHLKDVDEDLARQVSEGDLGFEEAVRRGVFKPLGEGSVDAGRVIELLEDSAYGGWYVLEQDVMLDGEPEEGEGPIENVRRSLAFVQSKLERGGDSGAA